MYLEIAAVLAVLTAAPMIVHKISWPKYNFEGKHVLVTGGSKGLGKSLAVELSKKGAHVSIVARGLVPLEEVKKQALQARKNPKSQNIEIYSCDVSDKKSVSHLMKEVEHRIGVPDCIIPCAGLAIPKMFVESQIEDFEKQMGVNYFGSVHVIWEGVRRMKEKGIKGRIVFVTSTMSLVSFAGYSSYAPTKYALRGLCDALRNELIAYGIRVQIAYPPSMDTEGFVEENKTKPHITKKIEDLGDLLHPDVVAKQLIVGVEKGGQHITFDLLTELQRIYSVGASQRSHFFLEILIMPILGIIFGALISLFDFVMLRSGKQKSN